MNALVLTPLQIPTERSFVAAGFAGTPEALAAARRGDIKRLDDLELAWLNAWGPKPDVRQDQLPPDMRGEKLRPMAMSIHHGCGPRAETLVEWAMVLPCTFCWRRQTRRATCMKCNGYGHTSDCWASVYAALDGVIVEIEQ